MQVAMATAALEVEPSCWCINMAFGFTAAVEGAYIAWQAKHRVWGCLVGSMAYVFSIIRICMVVPNQYNNTAEYLAVNTTEYQAVNTRGLVFACFVGLRAIGALPCLAVLLHFVSSVIMSSSVKEGVGINRTISQATKYSRGIQWLAEGMCMLMNLSAAMVLINALHQSDTGWDAKQIAALYSEVAPLRFR